MMNLIKTPSPAYKGTTQSPKNSGGLLSQIFCYLFGGGTPAYKGKDQSAAKPCGAGIIPDSPVYKQPVVIADTDDQEFEQDDCDGDEAEVPYELDGSNAKDRPIETMGPITIVIG